ncbi:alpha/beta hydrolase [Amaricoccus sp.]|uniref:alpha/beta hydrolase n=1 Tax=Amaricoccus sp. TaxID=1872485 RepID=UPI001B3F25FA|nr:alpha/beta hydrolase [Amaricoccus sp.]MBP7001245.1 alpha/beta hydrolase [Amaricoccus sp.]
MAERPPLLFLHGAFAGPEVWTRFVAPWFARRGHRVAAPVMPGRLNVRARLRDYVRAGREAAEELGRPVAIGHSLGGLVAQHLAAEGRLAGAVLVSSPGPMGLAPTLWNLSAVSPHVLAALMIAQAGAGNRLGTDLVRRALFTEETSDDWIAGLGLTWAPESPGAFADGLAWDLPAWPLARATPMLAVQGDRDAFVPVTDLWSIAMAYGAETDLLPGLAHGLPVDPAWKSLAWRINSWLGERQIGERAPRPWLTAFGFAS